jgi:hypothetical protein
MSAASAVFLKDLLAAFDVLWTWSDPNTSPGNFMNRKVYHVVMMSLK